METRDQEIISEDWLLENLPRGWSYDCTFNPEPAFLLYAGEGGAAPRYGPLRLPLRLLANPERENVLRDRLEDAIQDLYERSAELVAWDDGYEAEVIRDLHKVIDDCANALKFALVSQ